MSSATDYYPFGWAMPGRKFTSEDYRFGFNGMEKDDDIKGEGTAYTTEFRLLNTKIGRWLSVDPVKHFAQSPYNLSNNNPVFLIDPRGADGVKGKDGKITSTIYLVPDAGVIISEAYRSAAEANIKEVWGQQKYKGKNVDVTGVNVIIVSNRSEVPAQRDGTFNVVTVASGSGRSSVNGDGYTGTFHMGDIDETGNVVNNIFAHEFGHMLGLADLYNVVQQSKSGVSPMIDADFRNVSMPSQQVSDKEYVPSDNLMAGSGNSLTSKQMEWVFEKNKNGMTSDFQENMQYSIFIPRSVSLDVFGSNDTSMGVLKGRKIVGDGVGFQYLKDRPNYFKKLEFLSRDQVFSLQGVKSGRAYKTARTIISYFYGGSKGISGKTEDSVNFGPERQQTEENMKDAYH